MKLAGMLLGAALALSAASNDSFLIRNVDVYPVTAPEMKGVSLLVQDGKIADIGPKVVAPKGVPVIEGKGLRVYPGWIDSATALGLSEITESIREATDTNELGEFMPQLKAITSVNPTSVHFPVVRVNGVTAAITMPSLGATSGGGGGGRGGAGERQYIGGQAALIHTDGWTWEDMSVNPGVAMHLNFPTMGGRGGRGGGAPAEAPVADVGGGTAAGATQARRAYEDQITHISQFFDDARNYQKLKAAHLPGFKTDMKFEAMLPVLDGKVPLAIMAARATMIHDAIQFGDKQRVKIVIMEPRELGKAAAELKEKNIPVILGKPLSLPEYEDDPYDSSYTLPAEAYKAGVKFAFGSFENQFVRNLPYQAAAAVAFGLPNDEALKALTINPAQIWGVADQIGSVEKGKWADLIVADGDPLEIQTGIKHIYIKGKEVELETRQRQMYDKYLNRP